MPNRQSRPSGMFLLTAVMFGLFWLAGSFLLSHGERQQPPVVDATFGAYTHLYIFRDAEKTPWHFSTKDQGPITDLSDVPMTAAPDADHPRCLSVSFTFDPKKDLGMKWNDVKDGGMAISSRSQSLRILACGEPIPQFESQRGPNN